MIQAAWIARCASSRCCRAAVETWARSRLPMTLAPSQRARMDPRNAAGARHVALASEIATPAAPVWARQRLRLCNVYLDTSRGSCASRCDFGGRGGVCPTHTRCAVAVQRAAVRRGRVVLATRKPRPTARVKNA